MGINIQFIGDVDRLPHKDLAEKIIHAANEAIKAALEKAGIGDQFTARQGWEVRNTQIQTRMFLGSESYGEPISGIETVTAEWVVHLPDQS